MIGPASSEIFRCLTSALEFRILPLFFLADSLDLTKDMLCTGARVRTFCPVNWQANVMRYEFQLDLLALRRGLAGEELTHSRILAVIAQLFRIPHGHDALHLFI